MITDRDDFIATVEHRRPSRILYRAGFTPDLHRRVAEHVGTEKIGEHYGFMGMTNLSPNRPDHIEPIDYRRFYGKDELPEGTRISPVGAAQVPSGFYHFFGYISPLRNATSLKELEDYPLDDCAQWDISHYEETVSSARAAGRIVVGGVGHMYESAWQIRGYEEFLIDMMERPAWAECILDKLIEQARYKAVTAAKAGADYVHCGDDVASQVSLMFSKPMWEKFMLSRWRRVWQEVKEANPDCRIWYHSDGNVADIVGDLIEAGVDILNPLQPECLDCDALHRRYGDRLTFDGAIGTQSTMPFGSAEEVRARVKEVIEKYGQNGGLIISPTHILEPEVPLENIDALFDACREYGQFE
ncbi:MAG: hypothetical protein HOC74_16625 [Gemmatimonadetes bacterium]|nr:hypothetical protein [Gemmatimonadota bacterium]